MTGVSIMLDVSAREMNVNDFSKPWNQKEATKQAKKFLSQKLENLFTHIHNLHEYIILL